MAGGADTELTGTFGQQMLGMMVVISMAAIGGILVQICMKGITF